MTKHLDEARNEATAFVRQLADNEPSLERILLVDDLFGRIRVIVWPRDRKAASRDLNQKIDEGLRGIAGPFWSGDIWLAPGRSKSEQIIYDEAWKEGLPVGDGDKVRRADRHRTKGSWFSKPTSPPWGTRSGNQPPIIVFYSFKGGVGRTTALTAFALQRAAAGEPVVVIDFDLDAPGAGTLIASESRSSWGVVDYLLEKPIGDIDFRDYYHRFSEGGAPGGADIYVIPAGKMDESYLEKLARVDLEPPPDRAASPVIQLIQQAQQELRPSWVLIDSRSGLSSPAGVLLSGIAHLHVLLGTQSEQNWLGLRIVLERLGAERIYSDMAQADCLIVQAMVPENTATSIAAEEEFKDRCLDEFSDVYYASDSDDAHQSDPWTLSDAESLDAPHVPVAVHYTQRLAFFSKLDDVAGHLRENPDYRALEARILSRFSGSSQ